jgi:hypothetical protein
LNALALRQRTPMRLTGPPRLIALRRTTGARTTGAATSTTPGLATQPLGTPMYLQYTTAFAGTLLADKIAAAPKVLKTMLKIIVFFIFVPPLHRFDADFAAAWKIACHIGPGHTVFMVFAPNSRWAKGMRWPQPAARMG